MQVGLFVDISDDCFVKAGLEFADGKLRLSVVVTNGGFSDWSTQVRAGPKRCGVYVRLWRRIAHCRAARRSAAGVARVGRDDRLCAPASQQAPSHWRPVPARGSRHGPEKYGHCCTDHGVVRHCCCGLGVRSHRPHRSPSGHSVARRAVCSVPYRSGLRGHILPLPHRGPRTTIPFGRRECDGLVISQ
jgi:hypothetical protein